MEKLDKSFKDAATIGIANYQGADTGYAQRMAFFIEQFDGLAVTAITPERVEMAMDALARRGRIMIRTTRAGLVHLQTDKPLSPATLNRYLSALGTLFRDLRRLRITPRGFVSPTRGVERSSGDNARTVAVSVDDVRRLVAACRLTRCRFLSAITAMACTTGWRLGSLQALRWRDINLVTGTADVARTKNGTPHRAVLLPWVLEEVRRLHTPQCQPDQPVFGVHAFKKSWLRALTLADLPTEWTFHHTRHIAASALAQSGASVPTIMALLNQKTPSMALRYSHLNTTALREGLERAWS